MWTSSYICISLQLYLSFASLIVRYLFQSVDVIFIPCLSKATDWLLTSQTVTIHNPCVHARKRFVLSCRCAVLGLPHQLLQSQGGLPGNHSDISLIRPLPRNYLDLLQRASWHTRIINVWETHCQTQQVINSWISEPVNRERQRFQILQPATFVFLHRICECCFLFPLLSRENANREF